MRGLVEGERRLNILRQAEVEGKDPMFTLRTLRGDRSLTMPKKRTLPPLHDRPAWRVIGLYWFNHMRHTKSAAKHDRYHLAAGLARFGSRKVRDISPGDIEVWMKEQRTAGAAVNTINLRFSYLKAAFQYAVKKLDRARRLSPSFDPTIGINKLPGAKVRRFLLTPEQFEKNLEYLNSFSPRFGLFYLGLWETGRRPREVVEYCWEWVKEYTVEGRAIHVFEVPGEAVKTAEGETVVISDRLWREISMLAYRHGPVFRNTLGQKWNSWQYYQKCLDEKFHGKAGVIRDTRRGFVTRKVETEGHSYLDVMKQTGHRTLATFQRYLVGQLGRQAAVVNGKGKSTDFVQSVVNG